MQVLGGQRELTGQLGSDAHAKAGTELFEPVRGDNVLEHHQLGLVIG